MGLTNRERELAEYVNHQLLCTIMRDADTDR